MNVKKLDKKIIAGLVIIVVLFGVVLVQAFFGKRPTPNVVSQNYLRLGGFNSQPYGEFFRITSDDMEITPPDVNKSYRSSNLSQSYEFIKTAALKLGLSQESKNVNSGIVRWTKQATDDFRADSIVLDQKKGTVQVQYSKGINETKLPSSEYFKFVREFFRLPEYEVSILSQDYQQGSDFVSYSVKWQGRKVYFGDADNIYMSLVAFEGKVIQLFFYIMPLEFVEFVELNPIQSIGKQNIAKHYYKISLHPDTNSSVSEFGAESVVSPPVNIGFRRYEHAYIYFYDSKEGWLLLPVVDIGGVFSNSSDQRGEMNLLVVNQKPT